MAQAIDIRQPERQLTRTGIEVKNLAQAWRRQAQGDRFIEALLTFLNTRIRNRNTRRSYSFAITEFWAWYQVTHRRMPTPDKVRRSEAFAYSEYLQSRTIGLDAFRLSQDPERELDEAIYQYVLDNPGTRIDKIRQHLLRKPRFTTTVRFTINGAPRSLTVLSIEEHEPRGDARDAYEVEHGQPPPDPLDLRLACLVEHNLLKRTPTIAEIRDGVVDLGLDDPSRAQLDYRVDPETFSYYVDTHTETGTARVTTVALRLTALSSFWSFLIDTGENTGDDQPLLLHNVWKAPLKDVNRRVPARKQVARELSTPSLELIGRVLATAFTKSHGAEQAYEAAMTTLAGGDATAAAMADASVYDLRDRAVILFALLVGARAEEMARVRKSDLQPGQPTLVELHGKGDKPRLVGVPSPVMRALRDLYERFEELADAADPRARVHRLLEPNAPLLPAIKLWGRNETDLAAADDLRGLSPSGFQAMLRRRAKRAGIEQGDPEMKRIHPHGIRHLAALLAVDRGQPLPVIQATLGHASLAVTGQYVEQRDPERRVLMEEAVRRPQPPLERQRQVIEAKAEVTEEPAYQVPEDFEDEVDERDDIIDMDLEPAEEDDRFEDDGDLSEWRDPVVEEQEPEDEPEGIVGIGQAPEAPIMTPTDKAILIATEVEAIDKMLDVYQTNWGEAEKRARTKLDDRARGVLAQAYVGKRSGLPWWQGTGDLNDPDFSYVPNQPSAPAMPVVAPGQFLGSVGDATCEQPLCLGLVQLYDRWYHDEEAYGPTAAQALVSWVRTAARVTIDVDDVVRRRGGYWASFDAPLDDTRLPKGQAPRVLREHLDGAIIAWFEEVGWQFRPSQKAGEPLGGELSVPGWYAEADPLASLDARDRRELFDWLAVFTGLPPRDNEPRLGGVSRKDAGAFISAICQYEMIKGDDDLGFGYGLDPQMQQQSLDVLNQEIKKTVAKATRGRVAGFDYQDRRRQRKVDKTRQEMAREAAERLGSADDQQEDLRAMYSKYLAPYIMQLVGEIFGPVAGDDPLLTLFALCTAGAPLQRAGERYKSLFRVVGDTIEHTPVFRREFAQQTGAHSECVARRLARHIYEEGRAESWAKRRNWPETIEYLDAMSAYQVPCPGELEAELRDRLDAEEAQPVFEAWRDAQRRIEASFERDEDDEVAEVMREAAEREVARPARAPGAFETMRRNPSSLSRTRAAAQCLPNGALMAIWTTAMRRA